MTTEAELDELKRVRDWRIYAAFFTISLIAPGVAFVALWWWLGWLE
jgi:hypothetical protein